jgi:biotin carboxyl carrier protein
MVEPLGTPAPLKGENPMKYATTIDGQEWLVEIMDERHVRINGEVYDVDFQPVGDQPVYTLIVNGHSYEAHVYPDEDRWQVMFHGRMYSALVEDEREKRLRAALGGGVAEHEEFHLRAPMPGLVVSVPVTDGQMVHRGDILLVLESMKMQNELKSPRNGKVARLRVKPGDRVEQRDTMLSVV